MTTLSEIFQASSELVQDAFSYGFQKAKNFLTSDNKIEQISSVLKEIKNTGQEGKKLVERSIQNFEKSEHKTTIVVKSVAAGVIGSILPILLPIFSGIASGILATETSYDKSVSERLNETLSKSYSEIYTALKDKLSECIKNFNGMTLKEKIAAIFKTALGALAGFIAMPLLPFAAAFITFFVLTKDQGFSGAAASAAQKADSLIGKVADKVIPDVLI